MIDEINKAIESYQTKWQALVDGRADKAFFEALRPTAVGWKVADRSEYNRVCAELRDKSDRVIETWMNGRWIAKFHLRDSKLNGDVEIIKIMQRRPGSNDAVGLDHIDFYAPEFEHAEQILKAEPDLKWSWESNDVIEGYDWLSIWFAETEAKIKADTVLGVIIKELGQLDERLTSGRR
jgi:hypothetical protein